MTAIPWQIYLHLYPLIGVVALILVHELGQLIAAKVLGVQVDSFTIGVGPRALSFNVGAGRTSYGVAWVPLGAYAKIEGLERPDHDHDHDHDRDHGGRRAARLIIFAGPALCLLAAPAFAYLLYPGAREGAPAVVGRVLPEMPADEAGLRPGDRITAIDGEPVRSWAEMRDTILDSANQALRFTITRRPRGESLHKTIIPRPRHPGSRQGVIGISPFFELAQIVVAKTDSPAARAGLATGDVIAEVNGQPVLDWQLLERLLSGASGSAVRVRFRRAESLEQIADLEELERLPLRDAVVQAGRGPIGLTAAAMTVHRVEPGSPAEAAGLRAGDRVTRVDGKVLGSWTELLAQLRAAPEESHVISWSTPEGARREARLQLARVTTTDEHGTKVERLVFGAHAQQLQLLPAPVPVGPDLEWWLSDAVLLALLGLVVALVIFALKRALLPCWVRARPTEGARRRTVIPLVLGVLCLCAGSCEVYRGSWGATMAWRLPPSEEGPSPSTQSVGGPLMVRSGGERELLTAYSTADPGYDPSMRLLAIFGNAIFAVFGGIPLVLAVGLLRRRRWARLWTRVWAVAFLVISLAVIYLSFASDLRRYAGVAGYLILLVGWLLIAALPVAALVFLSRRRVKEAMTL